MTYLMSFLAERLAAPLWKVSPQGRLLCSACPFPAEPGPFLREIPAFFLTLPVSHEEPAILGTGEKGLMGISPGPEGWYLIGPCPRPAHSWLRYAAPECCAGPKSSASSGEPRRAEGKSTADGTGDGALLLHSLAQSLLLLYYAHPSADQSGPFLTPKDLLSSFCTQRERADIVWEKYGNLLFRNMEHGIVHNPYNQEIREYTAVENGDVEQVRQIQQEDYTERNGVLAFDPIRQEINLGIVVTTLARSAAARGGVSPEICYSLSDATIQEMENSRDPLTIRHIYRSSELRYARLVQESKNRSAGKPDGEKKDNLHIQHCKDYIFTHLHSKLTVRQIADAIGLEPNYLSALFHREEHVTLKRYILTEKIRLVKNMLAYSPYSYVEIANYLGFSSQSHLGEQFRRVTGITLRDYRKKYGKEDFLQEVAVSESLEG